MQVTFLKEREVISNMTEDRTTPSHPQHPTNNIFSTAIPRTRSVKTICFLYIISYIIFLWKIQQADKNGIGQNFPDEEINVSLFKHVISCYPTQLLTSYWSAIFCYQAITLFNFPNTNISCYFQSCNNSGTHSVSANQQLLFLYHN